MNIINLIQNGETKTLEFKEKLPSNDRIAKTIISFSNTAGGKLIIGVKDNRNIIGIDDNQIFELKKLIKTNKNFIAFTSSRKKTFQFTYPKKSPPSYF